MEITKVNIYKISGKDSLKAFASINIDDELVVKNLKVVEGKKGLFVSYPAEKGNDGEYYDQVYPLNKDTRDYISETIIEAYEKEDAKTEQKASRRSKK